MVCSVQLYDHVIRWWFLCALEQACIAPTTDLLCKFHGKSEYGHCHRYDQSALNILLANYFNNNCMAYLASSSVLTVERGSENKEEVLVCRSNRAVYRMKSRSYF